MSKRRDRIEAVNAAAIALASGNYSTQAELWSLCVFFEQYIAKGAKGTLKEFGPEEPGPAQILSLVRKGETP